MVDRMKTGTVFNIQRFCVHDGPGIRTTVFFKGCPLSCAWCHNPESRSSRVQLSLSRSLCLGCGTCADVCPKHVHDFSGEEHTIRYNDCAACGACCAACPGSALTLIGQILSAEDVLREIRKDREYYKDSGGVTLSGGEPLLQAEFCLELLRACRAESFSVWIETCGFCRPDTLEETALYADGFLFDFKLGDSGLHRRFTGVPNEPILRNLALLDRLGASVILRCPIIPGINDTGEHFRSIAVYSRLSCVRAVELMPYHTLGREKAAGIGAEYTITAPAVLPETAEKWRSELRRIGCEKLTGE